VTANGNAHSPPRANGASLLAGPWLCLATGGTAFLIVAAFFYSFEAPWTLRGDNMVALFPMNLGAYQSWLHGYAPEWSGGLWAGFPLLSDPTSGSLYWPNFPFFWLASDSLRAYDLSTAFHAALLTAGSVRLLQALGASPTAALFGGLLSLLAPTQQWFAAAILHSYSPLAWWPWLFLAAERLSRPATRAWGTAMWLAWLALASQGLWYPEFALYSGVLALLWLLTRNNGLPFRHRLGRAVLLGVGGLALAAPQLVPTVLYLASTSREASIPLESAGLVAFRGSLWSLFAGDASDASMPQYLGASALGLAAFALARRPPRALFLGGVAALGLVLALGARTPLYGLLHALPPFDRFRSPMKFFLLSEFAIAWLAALGASQLIQRGNRRGLIALGLALMAFAVGERLRFDAQRLLDETRLPGGRAPTFSSYQEKLRQSGLIEAVHSDTRRPPPRILEAVGLRHMSMLHGLEQLTGGPTPLRDQRHRSLIGPTIWSPERASARRAELDLWGVHFLLTPASDCEGRAERDALLLRKQTNETCLFENPSRPPRYSLLASAHSMPSWEAMTSFVKADPDGPVAILRPDAAPQRDLRFATGHVDVLAYRPGAVRLAVEAAGPALLFVRESLSAGWRAEVDGAEVPLHPAAGIFFALPVPTGEHLVELRFRTPGLRLGGFVAAAWIAGALGIGLARRHRRDPLGDAPEHQVA
jgi:hypothetical protein